MAISIGGASTKAFCIWLHLMSMEKRVFASSLHNAMVARFWLVAFPTIKLECAVVVFLYFDCDELLSKCFFRRHFVEKKAIVVISPDKMHMIKHA